MTLRAEHVPHSRAADTMIGAAAFADCVNTNLAAARRPRRAGGHDKIALPEGEDLGPHEPAGANQDVTR